MKIVPQGTCMMNKLSYALNCARLGLASTPAGLVGPTFLRAFLRLITLKSQGLSLQHQGQHGWQEGIDLTEG